MKKFWKNLCACSLAVACGLSLAGCGKDKGGNGDLDGDGVVSAWETMFESSEQPYYEFADKDGVTHIKSAEDLLAISKSESVGGTYILDSDIDLEGKNVCINLKGAHLYGGNHVIKNFTMHSEENVSSAMGLASSIDPNNSSTQYTVKTPICLFYNGASVNDLKIFAGVQSLSIQVVGTSYLSISPLFNVEQISNVSVKGKLDIDAVHKDGRSEVKFDASLLYSGMPTIASNGENDLKVMNVTNIENVNVEGIIDFQENSSTKISADIGAVASRLTEDSSLYNATVNTIINAGVSELASNIGGAVGCNNGFVSTVNYNANININNSANNGATKIENIGGIVGYNGVLAEVKNCKVKGKVNFMNPEKESQGVQSNYDIGGIAGSNEGGIIELCQMDADINVANLSDRSSVATHRRIGGLCGYNSRGIISYNICRGNINVTNVDEMSVAQAIGFSNYGTIEKLITNTAININNLNAVNRSKIRIGMVTVFDYKTNIADIADSTSPTFSRILVDGVSDVLVKDTYVGDVSYLEGLRNTYRYVTGQDENNQDISATILPSVFEHVYYMNTCKLTRRAMTDASTTPGHTQVSYTYVNNVTPFTQTLRNLINLLDFKSHMNHNEVSTGEKFDLNALEFVVTNETKCRQSYFGNGQYNGDLQYFDREFDESYDHSSMNTTRCDDDKDDEMLSFLNYLMVKNPQSYRCAIKISNDYLRIDNNGSENNISTAISALDASLGKLWKCLGVSVNDSNAEDEIREYPQLLDMFYGSSSELPVKYLRYVVSDISNQSQFTITFDVENMNISEVFEDEYIIYLYFGIESAQ